MSVSGGVAGWVMRQFRAGVDPRRLLETVLLPGATLVCTFCVCTSVVCVSVVCVSCVCVCVSVVCVRACVCVCVCVCERERERECMYLCVSTMPKG